MKRLFLLIGGVAAFVIGSKLLLENAAGVDLEAFASDWIAHAGTGSAATVFLLLFVDLVLPIPSSLVMILSGAAFGVWWGALLSLTGSIGGEWLGFELVRRYGRRASRRLVADEDVDRMQHFFARHGVIAVALTRALPVVMETMSVVAGLSGMGRGAFLRASLLGTTPIVFVYAYAGAASRQLGTVVPAIVILIAITGLAWIWYRSRATRSFSAASRG
jgi:3-dehydroquinate synthase